MSLCYVLSNSLSVNAVFVVSDNSNSDEMD